MKIIIIISILCLACTQLVESRRSVIRDVNLRNHFNKGVGWNRRFDQSEVYDPNEKRVYIQHIPKWISKQIKSVVDKIEGFVSKELFSNYKRTISYMIYLIEQAKNFFTNDSIKSLLDMIIDIMQYCVKNIDKYPKLFSQLAKIFTKSSQQYVELPVKIILWAVKLYKYVHQWLDYIFFKTLRTLSHVYNFSLDKGFWIQIHVIALICVLEVYLLLILLALCFISLLEFVAKSLIVL